MDKDVIMKQVVDWRKIVDAKKSYLKQYEELYKETPEYKRYLEEKESLSWAETVKNRFEDYAKQIGLFEYLQSKDKKPFAGIQVKEFTVVTITDMKQALQWAVDNLPSALKIVTRTFNSGVKSLEVDFVDVTKEDRVQIISSGLKEYDDD